MTDLGATIAPKSDQLNADDLISGSRTIRVTRVTAADSPEQPVSVFFEGDNGKPFKPCKSMRRVLVRVWGRDGLAYPGRSMTIYNDPEVVFGGQKVGGIRISHMSEIEQPITMALTATKASRKPYTVKPLKVEPIAPTMTPEQWLERHVAQINAAPDEDALNGVFQQAAKGLTKLRQDHPDLHAQAIEAGQRRAAEIAPQPPAPVDAGYNGV